MNKSKSSPARGKHRALLAALREKIVIGKIAPGGRLPTRRELGREFGVSSVTVQQALDHLSRDGFVVSRGVHGTFVSKKPPHLRRYGLIFQSDPSGGDTDYWPPAWHAVHQEAIRLAHTDRIHIRSYFNITGHTDVEDFQALMADAREQRLAGLMYVQVSPRSVTPELAERTGLPRVGLFMPANQGANHVIEEDLPPMVGKAVDYLVSRGRRRIAMLDVPSSPVFGLLSAALAARGLEARPYWIQEVNHRTPHTARRLAHLLLHGAPGERPDGLFISNPFLVEHATAGVVDSGLRVPADLDVVAACNFPWPTPTNVPVKWLGIDICAVLRQGIEMVDRLRRGEAVPVMTCVQSDFIEDDRFQAAASVGRPLQVSN